MFVHNILCAFNLISIFLLKLYKIHKVYWEVKLKFKRIKDLREDHDLLQREVAELLSISQQYYSEYENGNRPIPIQHLITLSKFYGTSIDYIVGLSNSTNNSRKSEIHKKTS